MATVLRKNLTDDPTEAAKKIFAEHARLPQGKFFKAVQERSKQDLAKSHFARVIYKKYTESHNETLGVNTEGLQLALDHLNICNHVYNDVVEKAGTAGISAANLGQLFMTMLGAMTKAGAVSPNVVQGAMAFLEMAKGRPEYLAEVFSRWDTDGSGQIDTVEAAVMGMAVLSMCDSYMSVGEGKPLTMDNYSKALIELGFADAGRLMQGLFKETIFHNLARSDKSGVGLGDFFTGVSRLLRPVNWEHQLHAIDGWPGWGHLSTDELSSKIASLETGDLLFTKLDDAMGTFLQFGTQSPWNHLAVVVRHAARPGIPNQETEQILQEYPFRRRGHVFCSPGFCRCFSATWEDKFPPSKYDGQGVSLLESSGEGIHVFDFGHRMFESPFGKRVKVAGIRRLRGASNRGDVARVEAFVHTVRGRVYTAHTGELKSALLRDATMSGIDKSSAFCSQAVVAFYKHMGWLEGEQSTLVMPACFDDPEGKTFPENGTPVQVVEGNSWGPMEIINSA